MIGAWEGRDYVALRKQRSASEALKKAKAYKEKRGLIEEEDHDISAQIFVTSLFKPNYKINVDTK